jgi:L-ascorbate metabolism protein UlaG (beta-lactamase superfamily)
VGGLRLSAGPARHFSGRKPWDEDTTLWVSWIIDTGNLRIFFSGDIGYHAGFREIGERYGPFDLAFHPWYEPFERIHALAHKAGVELATPMMGERLSLAPGSSLMRQA